MGGGHWNKIYFFNTDKINLSVLFFSLSFFLNLPIADSTLGTVEADTDFYQPLAFCMIWQHIAFFVYLCQSLLGTLYLCADIVRC